MYLHILAFGLLEVVFADFAVRRRKRLIEIASVP